jgi:signal transduction histidine kinase
MDYRARSIGAALEVQSERGHGTTVRCTLQGMGRDKDQECTD